MIAMVAFMVVFNVAEVTLFHYISSRNQAAALKTNSNQHLLGTSKSTMKPARCYDDAAGLPQTEESDYDSEDGATATGTWAYEGRQGMYRLPPPQAVHRNMGSNTLPPPPRRDVEQQQNKKLLHGSMTLGRGSPASSEIKFAETKV